MEAIESIYMAGKISRNDWRGSYVREVSDWENLSSWPITRNALCGLDYTGPYFATNGGHGITHGRSTHGNGLGRFWHEHDPETSGQRAKVKDLCLRAIQKADLFFAWIDTEDCYGTIAEIGYAKGIGKPVWMAGPGNLPADLWFAFALADRRAYGYSPARALSIMLREFKYDTWTFNSHIEELFWRRWLDLYPGNDCSIPLEPQYQVGRYRIDFAHIESKTAVELDGHASHSSPDAIAHDRKRQRELEAQGWHVIRFGGKEIVQDVKRCVSEVVHILVKRVHV
jgi:very-short-patch-repair endonuclease